MPFLDFLLKALHEPSLEGPSRCLRTNSVSPVHSDQTLECSRPEKPHQAPVAHLAVIRGSLSANQGILSDHRGGYRTIGDVIGGHRGRIITSISNHLIGVNMGAARYLPAFKWLDEQENVLCWKILKTNQILKVDTCKESN